MPLTCYVIERPSVTRISVLQYTRQLSPMTHTQNTLSIYNFVSCNENARVRKTIKLEE